MKLVYLWIEELFGYINVDYNLGSDFFFRFDLEKNTLTAEQNHHYIKNFFRINSKDIGVPVEINAIVGENGTGKTSILEAIRDITLDEFKGNYVLVYEENGTYLYSSKDKIHTTGLILHFLEHNNSKLNCLYYSNVFDVRYLQLRHIKNETYIDLTTNKLLKKEESVHGYFTKELTAQIEFVSHFEGQLFSNQFKVPEMMELRLIKKQNSGLPIIPTLQNRINQLGRYEILKVIFKSFFDLGLYENAKNRGFYHNYLKNVLFYYIYGVLDFVYTIYPIEKNKLIGLYQRFINAIDLIESSIKKSHTFSIAQMSDIITKFLVDTNSNVKFPLPKLKTKLCLNKLEKNCEKLISLLEGDEIKEIKGLSAAFYVDDLSPDLVNIFTSWQKMNLGGLEWHELSSGQYAMLSMFSRIYEASKKLINSPSKGLTLFLIDEGELYFHPQWQKEWITILLAGIKNIFSHIEDTVQVIVTTHSPFLLSDIPSDRVLFLHRTENNNVVSRHQLDDMPLTFGANIHTLYSHSFFLKEGLMGSFAKRKINHLAEKLIHFSSEQIQVESEELRKEIHAIGEPILKNKLIDLYQQKVNLLPSAQYSIEQEMGELKARIAKLEHFLMERDGEV